MEQVGTHTNFEGESDLECRKDVVCWNSHRRSESFETTPVQLQGFGIEF